MPPPSAISSPATFYTATDSVPDDQSTKASSPAQDPPRPYRDARRLPRELKEHCHILLEEQLYSGAINLLNSIACSGVSKSAHNKTKPILVPPPTHLALLNTLIIHPQHTSRVEKQDHLDVSSQALNYLRNLLTLIGPVNADLKNAFQFRLAPRRARRWGQNAHSHDSDLSEDDPDRDEDELRGKMPNKGSIWCNGQDFWTTLGWALNCSALHPLRWRYWKPWLEYMVDVLEADWAERSRRDTEAHQASGGAGFVPRTSRNDSMMAMYMDQQSGRQAGIKGIMKALFADGGEISSSAFREVFDKELKGPRKESRKRKRGKEIDLENGNFGDYLDDESISSSVSEPPTPQKPKGSKKAGTGSLFGSGSGMVDSIGIRLRLFKLLSEVVCHLQKRSQLNQLYEEYAAAIKVLPLPIYSLFVTQRPNALIPETHITIVKELFHLLLPSSYKDPREVDREADAKGCLTSSMLEECYIPNAANTVAVEDNAKLSLLVENSIQLLWLCDELHLTKTFVQAAMQGIKAREAKTKKKRTGKMKADPSDTLAEDILDASGERIQILLEVLRSARAKRG